MPSEFDFDNSMAITVNYTTTDAEGNEVSTGSLTIINRNFDLESNAVHETQHQVENMLDSANYEGSADGKCTPEAQQQATDYKRTKKGQDKETKKENKKKSKKMRKNKANKKNKIYFFDKNTHFDSYMPKEEEKK